MCRPGGGSRRVWRHCGRHPGARHVHRCVAWSPELLASCAALVGGAPCAQEERRQLCREACKRASASSLQACCHGGQRQSALHSWRGPPHLLTINSPCSLAQLSLLPCQPPLGVQALRCWAASTWRSTLTSGRWHTCECRQYMCVWVSGGAAAVAGPAFDRLGSALPAAAMLPCRPCLHACKDAQRTALMRMLLPASSAAQRRRAVPAVWRALPVHWGARVKRFGSTQLAAAPRAPRCFQVLRTFRRRPWLQPLLVHPLHTAGVAPAAASPQHLL